MARRIDEQYHTLRTKALQLREKAGKFPDRYTEVALATLDRELAARSIETEGFNVAGFIGSLAKAQDLRGS